MKLTLKIKLLPTPEQASLLLQTIREANRACNLIAAVAWEQKVFQPYKLHHASYYTVKGVTRLSSQVIIRCISKVANSYKSDRKVPRTFQRQGAIAYDSRILSYKGNTLSIWSVGGRLHMPFACHHPDYLCCIKGEAALLYRKGKIFVLQTVEVAEAAAKEAEEFIGVDFGLVSIATLSNGKEFSSKQLRA